MTNPNRIYLKQQLDNQIITESTDGELEIYTYVGLSSTESTSGIDVVDDSDKVNTDDVQLGFSFSYNRFNTGNYITTNSHFIIDGETIFFSEINGSPSTISVGGFDAFNATGGFSDILVPSLPRDKNDMTLRLQFARASGTNNISFANFRVYIDGVLKQERVINLLSPTLSNGAYFEIDITQYWDGWISYLYQQ